MASGVFQRAPGFDYVMDNLEADVFDVGGTAPSNIISAGQPWQMRLQWEAIGAVLPFFRGIATVEVFVESIGQGIEDRVGHTTVNIVPGQVNYQPPPLNLDVVNIPGNQTSIVAKVTTTVTVTDDNGNVIPMAGFVEGPMLHFI